MAFSTLRIFPLKEYGLKFVPALLGSSPAESPSTRNLHTKRILFGTVGQLTGQTPPVGFSLNHLFFTGGMTRLSCKDNLLNDGFGIVGMFFQIVFQHLRNRLRNSGTHSRFPNLVLVCPSNCGSATFTETMAVNPSQNRLRQSQT